MKTQGKNQTNQKRRMIMNGTMKRYNEMNSELIPENYNFSAYSMAAVAGGILLCLGIVLYAILSV